MSNRYAVKIAELHLISDRPIGDNVRKAVIEVLKKENKAEQFATDIGGGLELHLHIPKG